MIVPLEEKLLLRIHIHPSNVLPNPTFKGKVKVSVRKMISSFGVSSGICKSISQHIGDRKWKSAWLVLRPDEHSWFIMERVFWKNSHTWWVKNDQYNLTKEEKDILLDDRSRLNDNLIDAAQKLICKSLDNLECYQTVLNSQKKDVTFFAVTKDHIQIMYDGKDHWLLSFIVDGRVQVFDILGTNLSIVTRRCLKALYSMHLDQNGKLNVALLPVQRQSDGNNCGLFAIAFAADIMYGLSPMESFYDTAQMRNHLISCLENSDLSPFPKL